ncbi:DsbC family protein [Acinetobacter larvae]|uniref:Thiol:disulfide interchange protein n=1 Tax=Acinetobacter larvae TaxID=1789224 RepID=A0A1B2LX48_9GAMM|nr:DsbC family protein [Acinetobacter larvae]AOA57514.1 thiol:disulfide interchange protein [Acinetobacter larvae]
MKIWSGLICAALWASTTAHADINTLQNNLKNNFPEIPVESVTPTAFDGIYEVYTGDRIVYTDDKAKYFLVGNLIDLAAQHNITDERQAYLNRIDPKQFPIKQAIKQVKGNGQHILYVFTDPDCPYCKKLESELEKVDNTTIYTFMMPITQLHPNAFNISAQIWCDKKPYQAWSNYMLKQQAPTAKTDCKHPIQQNIDFAQQHKISGTPTFFLADGSRFGGVRSAEDIQQLLKQVAAKPKS